MGRLIKQFSIVGIVSQLIWALLLFSSFDIGRVLKDFGSLGPAFLGVLALTTIIGWLLMVAFLLTNEEIENKVIWFLALFVLPGQFVFWIQFILDSDALEGMNEPTFNRQAFIEEHKVKPVRRTKTTPQPEQTPSTKRPRGLTPPVFMSLDREQVTRNSRPRL